MKKVIIFGSIVVILFATIAFITNSQNKQQVEGNPFGKNRLHSETIDQLDDPLYQNIILPDELDEKLENKEDVTVYFYSGRCELCDQASPIVVPKAEEMGIDLKMYNILEFEKGWNDFGIEGTPTIIHFADGEEDARVVGPHDEETYEQVFDQIVLGN
ncbi:thioredoxin family protein [Salipaludibacillus sp. HK11]|uniref:thioredoxin family protein n=1 Tax=Salipaludibacillus sp. HK11 TaxID=3394320 RepID=UPI0039FDBB33